MTYNTNGPNGLRPVRYRSGSPWNGATNQYNIASGYGTGLFNGDPVTTLSDGTIGIGVAGAQCRGIFMGAKYTQTDGTVVPGGGSSGGNFWPASTTVQTGTTAIALIMDDNNVIMTAQETNGSSAAGTPLALADRGLNINFAVGTGNTRTGMSGASINNTTEATTSTLNLKIIDLDPTVGNAVGSFANWLVAWNVQQFQSVGTVGV